MVLSESTDSGSPALRLSEYTDPQADLLTPTVRFGRQRIGRSYTAPVYVTNRGTSLSTVNGMSFTANDGQFSLVDPGVCVGNLAAGATCEAWVRFTPSTEGPATATLAVDSSEGMREAEITGAGQVAKSLRLGVSRSPAKVRAGRKVRIDATVRNNGGVPVSRVRLCVSTGRWIAGPGRRCANFESVAAGKSVNRVFRLKVRRNTKRGGPRLVKVVATGGDVLNRRKVMRVRVR